MTYFIFRYRGPFIVYVQGAGTSKFQTKRHFGYDLGSRLGLTVNMILIVSRMQLEGGDMKELH